jgi:hypothetical protein
MPLSHIYREPMRRVLFKVALWWSLVATKLPKGARFGSALKGAHAEGTAGEAQTVAL